VNSCNGICQNRGNNVANIYLYEHGLFNDMYISTKLLTMSADTHICSYSYLSVVVEQLLAPEM
jgi:hypothetical protein